MHASVVTTRSLSDLPTQCLLLDRARLERNCARMRAIAAKHGVRLRPHLKTAKSMEVAEVALGDAAFRGGAVSTLEEAACFLDHGLRDLTYAVSIAPAKLDHVARVQGEGRVGVLTDELDVARAIAAHPASFDVWIEIDSGQRRGGIEPEDPRLIELARTLSSTPRGRLRGVLTHAGHSYACRSPDEIVMIAEEERRAAVEAAERIRAIGVECPEVSVGSTPTAIHARSLEGVTELRPGVYVFGDLFQAALGACADEDIAVSVLASVIVRRDDCAWIDAGALALTQDRSMDGRGGGFGEVRALDLAALPGRPRVESLHQVHGSVPGLSDAVGARVRVLPNHACLTAAMFDRYHVVDGERVIGEWPRLRG